MKKKAQDGGFEILAIIIIILVVGTVGIFINNYKENRQCEILSKGNTSVQIEEFYLVYEKCYIELEGGKLINADNYRGMIQ